MGAWGEGPFENDSACDWLGEATVRGLDGAAQTALERAQVGGYLEVDEGSTAVAAAALVAATLDGDHAVIPEQARPLVAAWKPGVDVQLRAVEALGVVLGGSSELASLWGGSETWRASLEAIRLRIASGAS